MPIKFLKRKIDNLITRAVLKLIKFVGGQMIVQVSGLSDEIRSDVEHKQQYGFRSKPREGASGLWLALGGNKDSSILILLDDKRFGITPDYEDGESRQYDDSGAFLRMFDDMQFSEADSYEWKTTSGDKLELMDGEFKITIGSTTFEFTSTGLLVTGGGVKANLIDLETHKHPINSGSSAPGPTGTPVP